jgi:hypothetical protein
MVFFFEGLAGLQCIRQVAGPEVGLCPLLCLVSC